MKIETAYTFNHDEIHDRLHYQLIVESIGSDRWNTGPNKRKLQNEFTEDEIENIKKIYKKSYNWYTHTGIPDTVTLSSNAYKLWLKLVNYCIKNFTIYGNKN